MECEKSLQMLSDFRDGSLDELNASAVRAHLEECPPCAGVFDDIDAIILSASVLHTDEHISFPDEDSIWQRMALSKLTIH